MARLRFLLSSHGASLFGAERVILALAHGLIDRGHRVTLELPHDGAAVERAQRIEGVRVTITGRPRLPRNATELLQYGAGLPAGLSRLSAAIHAEPYDVVWVNSVFNLPGALAARRSSAVVVWHLHERNFPGAAGWLAARVIRTLCDVAVVPSHFVADSFIAAGLPPAGLRVVPNALLQPITPTPLRSLQRPFVLGYVGQFEPRKHVTDMVEALTLLDGVTALLIGDGKARRVLEAVIARLRLDSRVRLTGFQHDIRPFMAQTDCIVVPSRNEPFGLVALEAMAAGKPVIAADSGALPEVLGDAALYYPLGNRTALAACVRQLRDDPALAIRLRERGLVRVRAFSLDRWLDEIEALTDHALATRCSNRRNAAHN